jgi:N-acetylglutamate synthase-like GNAT family acetyltransferase
LNLARATSGELAEIVFLMNRSYRGEQGWAVEQGYIEGERISLPDLKAELAAKPQMHLLVWREQKQLLGCVSLELLGDGVCYLGALTVEPTRQNAGAGRDLLAQAEDVARQWGANRMCLTVIWLREALIRWYERRGYVATGETLAFPYGDHRWGKPMRDDLYFRFFEKGL